MYIIRESNIAKAEQVLIDNGIEKDEAATVLQAVGYVLLDEELYPKGIKKRPNRNMMEFICTGCSMLAVFLAVFLFMEKNEKLFWVFIAIAYVLAYTPNILRFFYKKQNN